MLPAFSIDVGRARSARAALHGAAGWLACLLPVAVAHAPAFWAWNALAAAACAAAGAGQARASVHSRRSPLAGVAVLSGAQLADFASTYPDAVLALCSSASFVDDWVLHVRLFPFTAAAMVGLSVAAARGERGRRTRWPKRIVDAAVALGAMMFAMNLAAMLLKTWAGLAGWPWGAHALVCTMLVGMMLDHAAMRTMSDAIAAQRASHAIE